MLLLVGVKDFLLVLLIIEIFVFCVVVWVLVNKEFLVVLLKFDVVVFCVIVWVVYGGLYCVFMVLVLLKIIIFLLEYLK